MNINTLIEIKFYLDELRELALGLHNFDPCVPQLKADIVSAYNQVSEIIRHCT